MGEGGVMVFDPQLRAKISEWVIVKLFPIIWNQNSRDPIPTDDVPPDEAPHVWISYELHSMHPVQQFGY